MQVSPSPPSSALTTGPQPPPLPPPPPPPPPAPEVEFSRRHPTAALGLLAVFGFARAYTLRVFSWFYGLFSTFYADFTGSEIKCREKCANPEKILNVDFCIQPIGICARELGTTSFECWFIQLTYFLAISRNLSRLD